jgi:hypothetical protein
MNIESKRFKVSSGHVPGRALVESKVTGRTAWAALSDVPSAHALAMMSEASFDRAMADLLNANT